MKIDIPIEEIFQAEFGRHPTLDPVGRIYTFSSEDMMDFAVKIGREAFKEGAKAQRRADLEEGLETSSKHVRQYFKSHLASTPIIVDK